MATKKREEWWVEQNILFSWSQSETNNYIWIWWANFIVLFKSTLGNPWGKRFFKQNRIQMNLHRCRVILKPSDSSYFHQSCAKHVSQLVLLQQNFMLLTALSKYPVEPDETRQLWTQSESSWDACISSDSDARLCWLKSEGRPAHRLVLKNCTCHWQEILFIRQQDRNGVDL